MFATRGRRRRPRELSESQKSVLDWYACIPVFFFSPGEFCDPCVSVSFFSIITKKKSIPPAVIPPAGKRGAAEGGFGGRERGSRRSRGEMDGGLKALLKESAAVALGSGSGGTEKVSPSFRLQRIQTADRTADPAGEALDCANMLPKRPGNASSSSPRRHHQPDLRSSPRKRRSRRPGDGSSRSEQRLDAVLGILGQAGPAVRRVQKQESTTSSVKVSYVHTPGDPRTSFGSKDSRAIGAPSAHATGNADGTAEYEQVRQRLRMASALNKLGINLGQEIIDQWMSHESYDGARSFGSLAVLYEIKLAELLAAIPRTVGRLPGNYPNKVRTALVLGIFRELSNSKALGKYGPMLRSILSTVIDATYVCSVRELSSGDQLSSSHFGEAATWYDLARAQAKKITALEEELLVAASLRKKFLAHKKIQQRVLERIVARWKHALTSRVLNAWKHWWQHAKHVRELTKMILSRKFFQRDRELMRITWVAWSAFTRSVVDARLHDEGWSDVDEKSILEAERDELREQLNKAIEMLRKTVTSFRLELGELKATFEARLQLALASQATDLASAIETARVSGAKEGTASIPRRDVSTQVGFAIMTGGGSLNEANGDAAEKKPEKEEKEEEPSSPPKKKKKKKKKPYKGRTLNAAKVLDTIAAMYEKKIKADAIDDQAGKDRDTLEEFAEDFFMQMYGTVMMKKKMAEFKHSVGVHKKDNIRIKWFSTFIGYVFSRFEIHSVVVFWRFLPNVRGA